MSRPVPDRTGLVAGPASRAVRTPLAALGMLAALVSWGGQARADWLLVMPPCALRDAASGPGRMEVVYPREGLPAVVTAGEPLVARVRVPSALTPPPGIQRDRALVGWSAEIRGASLPIALPAEHRYGLRVANVRPDDRSRLVYRATLVVPAWAAPGTYELRMSAPGGRDVVESAVRILAPGEPARVATLAVPPDRTPVELAAVLAVLPVDVWVVGPGSPRLPGVVTLVAPAPAALRIGRDAFLAGTCPGSGGLGPHSPAALAAAGVAGPPRRLPGPPPAGSARLLDGAEVGLPAAGEVAVTASGGQLSARSPVPVEIDILVPDDARPSRVRGGTVEWWPATPVDRTGYVPSLLGRIRAPGDVTVERGDVGPRPTFALTAPSDAEAGDPITFGADGPQRIAWWLEEDRTFLGPHPVHRFHGPGRHEVRALGLSGDGVAVEGRHVVKVRPRAGGSCDAAPGRPEAGTLLLVLAFGMIGRRVARSARARE